MFFFVFVFVCFWRVPLPLRSALEALPLDDRRGFPPVPVRSPREDKDGVARFSLVVVGGLPPEDGSWEEVSRLPLRRM